MKANIDRDKLAKLAALLPLIGAVLVARRPAALAEALARANEIKIGPKVLQVAERMIGRGPQGSFADPARGAGVLRRDLPIFVKEAPIAPPPPILLHEVGHAVSAGLRPRPLKATQPPAERLAEELYAHLPLVTERSVIPKGHGIGIVAANLLSKGRENPEYGELINKISSRYASKSADDVEKAITLALMLREKPRSVFAQLAEAGAPEWYSNPENWIAATRPAFWGASKGLGLSYKNPERLLSLGPEDNRILQKMRAQEMYERLLANPRIE